jgi:hypothetical protein
MVMPLISRSDVPVFLTLIDPSGASPILTFPKLKELGVGDIRGTPVCPQAWRPVVDKIKRKHNTKKIE